MLQTEFVTVAIKDSNELGIPFIMKFLRRNGDLPGMFAVKQSKPMIIGYCRNLLKKGLILVNIGSW